MLCPRTQKAMHHTRALLKHHITYNVFLQMYAKALYLKCRQGLVSILCAGRQNISYFTCLLHWCMQKHRILRESRSLEHQSSKNLVFYEGFAWPHAETSYFTRISRPGALKPSSGTPLASPCAPPGATSTHTSKNDYFLFNFWSNLGPFLDQF